MHLVFEDPKEEDLLQFRGIVRDLFWTAVSGGSVRLVETLTDEECRKLLALLSGQGILAAEYGLLNRKLS